jgi:ABC-type branched-subunit amino acid transport system ATPase component
MILVKTFATPIKIFATMQELRDLDDQVTVFLKEQRAASVYSLSDTTTAGENGETIGLIRTVAYEVAD